MYIHLDNLEDREGMVYVQADNAQEARDDQSIEGSNWEFDGPDFAYALIMDSPDLLDRLKYNGYEVDDSEYSPPDPA